jgi:hypothetical protein
MKGATQSQEYRRERRKEEVEAGKEDGQLKGEVRGRGGWGSEARARY